MVNINEAEVEGTFDITVEEIERYGPALLVDHESPRGDRLLIWTD